VIIAAVAIHYGLTLLTDNVKDFPIENLALDALPRA
jgi:predicted nucleic acid-binding protein